MILLIVALGYGARYNQGSSCIINQYTVNFIHHGKMMFTLYHFIGRMHHIIPQVIKPKFIIGTINDITVVCFAAIIAVGFVFINTVYGEAEPFK